MVIKKYVLSLVLLLSLFSLSACTNSTLRNVDTFISCFNEFSDHQISKSDFYGFSENGVISHCLMVDDILISLDSKEENMEIMSADVLTEKTPDEKYKSVVRLMLKSLTTLSDSDISNITDSLIKTDSDFMRLSDSTYEYSFSFVFLDVGSKFTLSFNRLVPTQTTNIPATEKEFSEYSTIADSRE